MPHSVAKSSAAEHLLKTDLPLRMAKVGPEQVRKADLRWRRCLGQAVDRARVLANLSLKEFAALIDRDERQCAKWISGEDRPQFDVLFAVPELRQALVIAIAELVRRTAPSASGPAASGIRIQTVITVEAA